MSFITSSTKAEPACCSWQESQAKWHTTRKCWQPEATLTICTLKQRKASLANRDPQGLKQNYSNTLAGTLLQVEFVPPRCVCPFSRKCTPNVDICVLHASKWTICPEQLAWHAPHLAPNVSRLLFHAQEGEHFLKMVALGQEWEVWPQRRG